MRSVVVAARVWWSRWKRGAYLLVTVGFASLVGCVPAILLVGALGRASFDEGVLAWLQDPVFLVTALACAPAYVATVLAGIDWGDAD